MSETKIVTTIPLNSGLKKLNESTFDSLINMINDAKKSILISALFINLTTKSGQKSGDKVFKAIKEKLIAGISVNIIVSGPIKYKNDLDEFKKFKNCKVSVIDMNNYFSEGVVHQKIIIIDDKTAYIGSSNLSNASYEYTGELGLVTQNPNIVSEICRIYAFWNKFSEITIHTQSVERDEEVPFIHKVSILTEEFNIFKPKYTKDNLQKIISDGETSNFCFGVSPNRLALGGSTELDLIVHAIDTAEKYVNISVMTLCDVSIYNLDGNVKTKHFLENRIFDAIKNGIISRNLTVNIMVAKSTLQHTIMIPRLLNLIDSIRSIRNYSLSDNIGDINIKLIKMPDPEAKTDEFDKLMAEPHNVQHCKYLTSDKFSIISTSNWTPDYYYSTAGLCFMSDSDNIRNQLKAVFDDAWNAHTTHNL